MNKNNKIKSKDKTKYQLMFFARYMGDSFFYPFLSLFLTIGLTIKNNTIFQNPLLVNNNISIEKASYFLMILPFVSIFINPIWTVFAKDSVKNKKLVSFFSFIEGALIILLSLYANNIYLVFILFLLIAIVGQPVYYLIDSFAKEYCEKNKIKYLSLRIMGSMAYVVGPLLAGVILNFSKGSFVYVFLIAGFLFILTSIIIGSINDKNENLRLLNNFNNKPEKIEKPNIKELLKNSNFYLVLGFLIFSGATMTSIDTYIPNYFEKIFNFSSSYFSYLLSGFVLVEVLVMVILVKIGKKISYNLLSLILVNTIIIRYLLFMSNINIYVSIIAQLVRGISMAVYLYLFLEIILKYIKLKNLTYAVIILGSISAIYKTLLTYLGGIILRNNNYNLHFFIGIILEVISLLFLFFLKIKNKSK